MKIIIILEKRQIWGRAFFPAIIMAKKVELQRKWGLLKGMFLSMPAKKKLISIMEEKKLWQEKWRIYLKIKRISKETVQVFLDMTPNKIEMISKTTLKN